MHVLTQRITLVRAEAERLQDYLETLSPSWRSGLARTNRDGPGP